MSAVEMSAVEMSAEDVLCREADVEIRSLVGKPPFSRGQSVPELANQDDARFTLRWGMTRNAADPRETQC